MNDGAWRNAFDFEILVEPVVADPGGGRVLNFPSWNRKKFEKVAFFTKFLGEWAKKERKEENKVNELKNFFNFSIQMVRSGSTPRLDIFLQKCKKIFKFQVFLRFLMICVKSLLKEFCYRVVLLTSSNILRPVSSR